MNNQEKCQEVCQTPNSKWDDAIKDAETQIEDLAKKSARLKQAVRIFRANKRDGVPWPGDVTPLQNEGKEQG